MIGKSVSPFAALAVFSAAMSFAALTAIADGGYSVGVATSMQKIRPNSDEYGRFPGGTSRRRACLCVLPATNGKACRFA